MIRLCLACIGFLQVFMGYDLLAYFDLNQEDFAAFLAKLPPDIDFDKKNVDIARSYLRERCPELGSIADLRWMVDKIQDTEMYEMSCSHHSSFIRDCAKLDNRRFIKCLEDVTGEEYPQVLTNMNWAIRTREDAMEAVKGIRTFYKDDAMLMGFARWLAQTAPNCSTYELSW